MNDGKLPEDGSIKPADTCKCWFGVFLNPFRKSSIPLKNSGIYEAGWVIISTHHPYPERSLYLAHLSELTDQGELMYILAFVNSDS